MVVCLESPDSPNFPPRIHQGELMSSRTHTAFMDNVRHFSVAFREVLLGVLFSVFKEDLFAVATVSHICHLVWHPKWREWEIF